MFVNTLRFFHLFSSSFGLCNSLSRLLFRSLCIVTVVIATAFSFPQKSLSTSVTCHSYCTRHINRKRFVHLDVPIFIIIAMLFVDVLVFHRPVVVFFLVVLLTLSFTHVFIITKVKKEKKIRYTHTYDNVHDVDR